jgi:hypothetical protein
MNITNTDTRRTKPLLFGLILALAAGTYVSAEAGDRVEVKKKKKTTTKKGSVTGNDLIIDAKPIEYFDGKRINKKLARKIAKGKGALLGWAGCPKLDEYDCMTITVGNDTSSTSYVVLDRKCESRRRAKKTKRSRTCLGGYGLVSKATTTTNGWQRSTYETRDGHTRTKQSLETVTKLFVAGNGTKKTTSMNLLTRTEHRTELFSSGQVNTSFSIYDADGNVWEDQSLCPSEGQCADQGSTYIASQSEGSIRDCDTEFADGGTQDMIIDATGVAAVGILTATFTVSGSVFAGALVCAGAITCVPGVATGGTLGGAVGATLGGGVALWLQVKGKQHRDKQLHACRASHTCDEGKSTSEGIEGCTCDEHDDDPTDEDSCAAAKEADDDKGSSSDDTNIKGEGDGNDNDDPMFQSCRSDSDCPAGWMCSVYTKKCIR